MEFRVGDWRAIATTNELVRGQERVRIEARAMDVLKLLYEHQGNVVSKNQLIDTVWKLHVVSDHSITVVISNLRRALKDDPKKPRYIETIPKRGYRLLVDDSKEIGLLDQPGAEGRHETQQTFFSALIAHPIQWLIMIAALCIVMLSVWFLDVSPAPKDVPRLFVLDTENTTSDSALDPLAATITELTLDTLSHVDNMQLVRWRSEPSEASFSAQYENVWVLAPKLVVGERGTLLAMQLKNQLTNQIEWSTTQPISLRHFRLAEATAIKGIASALQLSISVNQHPRFSALAEEMFWRARYLWSLRQKDTAIRARQMLLEVLEIEPDFARAHTALADLYIYKTGGFFYGVEDNPIAKAKWHIEKAEMLSPEFIDLYLAKAHYALFVDGKGEDALTHLIKVTIEAPNNVVGWVSYANALASVGRITEAVEAITVAQAVDPMDPALKLDKVWILFLAERYEDAILAADAASDLGMSGDLYRGLVWGAAGQHQKAVEAWVAHFKTISPQSAQAKAIFDEVLMAVRSGNHEKAYHMLGDLAVPASSVLGAMLYSLATDYERAHDVLKQTKTAEENWIKLWAHRVPILKRAYLDNAAAQ